MKWSEKFINPSLLTLGLLTINFICPTPTHAARITVPCQSRIEYFANGAMASCILSSDVELTINTSRFQCRGGEQIFFNQQGEFISCTPAPKTYINNTPNGGECPPSSALRFTPTEGGNSFIKCSPYNHGTTVVLIKTDRPYVQLIDNRTTYTYKCDRNEKMSFSAQTEQASCILAEKVENSSFDRFESCQAGDEITVAVLPNGSSSVQCTKVKERERH